VTGDELLMRHALGVARGAGRRGEVPVGALAVAGGVVVAGAGAGAGATRMASETRAYSPAPSATSSTNG